MNFAGLTLGLAALTIIGLGFFWVVRVEFYLGWTWWPYVFVAGLALVLVSLFIPWPPASAVVGAFGASILWGATELKNQAARVEHGWYPANPKGKKRPPLEKYILTIKAPSL